MRGTVAVPMRDKNGTLLGYIGISEAKLPADFTTNVVAIEKNPLETRAVRSGRLFSFHGSSYRSVTAVLVCE